MPIGARVHIKEYAINISCANCQERRARDEKIGAVGANSGGALVADNTVKALRWAERG